MPLDEPTKRRFKEECAKARAEFEANWRNWTVRDVADWWSRWCVVGRAYHDCLGRILMEVTGAKPARHKSTVKLHGLDLRRSD